MKRIIYENLTFSWKPAFKLLTDIIERKSRQDAFEQLLHRLRQQVGSSTGVIAAHAAKELRAYGWLEDGSLHYVDLSCANLSGVNLMGANLYCAELRGANLRNAQLQGAKLYYAKFNEKTILPDGTRWAPRMSLLRFTDPRHRAFWKPPASQSEPLVYRRTQDIHDTVVSPITALQ